MMMKSKQCHISLSDGNGFTVLENRDSLLKRMQEEESEWIDVNTEELFPYLGMVTRQRVLVKKDMIKRISENLGFDDEE